MLKTDSCLEIQCPICNSKVRIGNLTISQVNVEFLINLKVNGIDDSISVLRTLYDQVPSMKYSISNETALRSYFERIHMEVSQSIVSPVTNLVTAANSTMLHLTNLADKVPFELKKELGDIRQEVTGNLRTLQNELTNLKDQVPASIQAQFIGVNTNILRALKDLENKLNDLSAKVPASVRQEFSDIERTINSKIKDMEKSTTEAPLMVLRDGLNPVQNRLQELADKVPKDVKSEFNEIERLLEKGLEELKDLEEKGRLSVNSELKALGCTINSLINKPTIQGRVGEMPWLNYGWVSFHWIK
jgi:hypothetical protein